MPEQRTYTRDDFNFELPDNLIAQYPAGKRDQSRLMVLNRGNGALIDDHFFNISRYIRPGDIMVFNNTRVQCARSFFMRKSGAKVEVIFARELGEDRWLIATNRTRRLKPGEVIFSERDPAVTLTVIMRQDDFILVKSSRALTGELLSRIGDIPLPPYIRRSPEKSDRVRYQTVYAAEEGSAASPTAGLHFTDDILSKLKKKASPTSM